MQLGFFSMLRGLYAAIAAISSMIHRFAMAGDNLGRWAEESTAGFVAKAAVERQQELADFKKQLKLGNQP